MGASFVGQIMPVSGFLCRRKYHILLPPMEELAAVSR